MEDSTIPARLFEPWPSDQKYLIGVSGGRDSMALWHGLRAAGFRDLVVCHLNHRLRGSESEADAVFVRDHAESWDCIAEVGSVDVLAEAKARKLSIETAARRARHEFFAAAARKHDCGDIFLAHHADDQVETTLINLCRGTGQRGVAAMSRESGLTVEGTALRLIRPLLEIWRSEIDDYIRLQGIDFREDATNAETSDSTRNRVRHELIPLMEALFERDPRGAIWRFGKVASDEDRAMEAMVDELWPEIQLGSGSGLDSGAVLDRNSALQRRILHRWLREKAELPACGFREIEAIRAILPPDASRAKINLPGGWHVRRREGRIFLQPPERD